MSTSLSIGSGAPPDAIIINLDGRLVLPALIDAHIHLDKTLLGLPWHSHRAENSIIDRIDAEKKFRHAAPPPIEQCGGRLLHQALRNGTLAVRSHVDIDNQTGLKNVEALLRLREAWSDVMAIQLVAFPQSGITRCPGVTDLLDEAVSMGCDLIGGLDPLGIDQDADGQLDFIFRLAQRRGVGNRHSSPR